MNTEINRVGPGSRWVPELALLLVWLATVVGRAQSVQTVLDPVCRLPRLDLAVSGDPGSVLVLRGADDPEALSTAPALLQMADDGDHHRWFDPEARIQQRRFYRLERVPRPPLDMVPDFRLTDHLGFSHQLFHEGDAKAVALVFVDADSLAATWSALQPVVAKHAPAGVVFWLIDPVDDRVALAKAAAAAGVELPVLHDAAQLVARTFGATAGGEVVLINGPDLTTLYRGPVQDVCDAGNGTSVVQTYLADTLATVLAGKPLAWERVAMRGPALAVRTPEVPAYSTAIAPLLQARCVECHRPGGIAPWSMTNHATVAAKAEAMRVNVLEALMPPWHADPAHQKFANDFSLTPAEQAGLVAWIDAGAPRGTGPDPLAETVLPPPVDWPLGPPDYIVQVTGSIPARSVSETIPYVYSLAANPIPTNAWLRAAVVKPGNRRVVHHALVFSASTAGDILQVKAGLGGYFAGYVPGMDQVAYPAGTAKLIKKGSLLVFQMHYTPIETAQTDRTQIGLYLATAPPAMELKTGAAYTTDFVIPPRAAAFETGASLVFDKSVWLYELSPHMHYRGDRMRFVAEYPDGTSEILLNVPKYDFAWQALYRLSEPKLLPAGTRVRVTGAFDNSVWNPFNPDPMATVRFGEQTQDEMFIGYMNYAVAP